MSERRSRTARQFRQGQQRIGTLGDRQKRVDIRKTHEKVTCSATTRKGKPCPINADRYRGGVWFCHVHDPQGTFRQQQQAAARPERTAPKPAKTTASKEFPPQAPESARRLVDAEPDRFLHLANCYNDGFEYLREAARKHLESKR